MEYDHLSSLRRSHPAWRLLGADTAPLVIGFLHHCYVQPNVRTLSEPELSARLDDYLHHIRQGLAEEALPRAPLDYLRDWASDSRGWLRRYYRHDSDEPHFDLTPAAEQAVQWVLGLQQRSFVGTESRLKLVFDLLRQATEGSQSDPEVRIAELQRRRAAIDTEIEQVRAGTLPTMDATQVRERFLQAADTARALLADFRQVEQNFRELDRQIRERIATHEGAKGDILEEVFGERDVIADSDQGRTFRAFWDFLMSPARQEELTSLLEGVLALEPVAELHPDPRLKRIHYDWLDAGEITQHTIARLSQQLRRYLDDRVFLENRRIMTIIRDVERHALAVRETPPTQLPVMIDEPSPNVSLTMDRPLFMPPIKPHITRQTLHQGGADEVPADALYEQFFVDRQRLTMHLRQALQTRRQVSLAELLQDHPLEQGLAELVAWLALATDDGNSVIDESHPQTIDWIDPQGRPLRATMPSVIFTMDGSIA
ncbi:MAG: DUF3375 domain-containing protein [bacterium]|nr:DUF3375 domain-containing protein [bacterium]